MLTEIRPRPWLHVLYQARRERTVTFVKAAVDRLVGEGKTVTIEAICQVSREVDSEGKGIKKAGVLGNAEAYAYYQQHSTTYQQAHRKLRHAPRQQPTRSTTLPHIDLDRDVTRVRQRYAKLSKAELVERLLCGRTRVWAARTPTHLSAIRVHRTPAVPGRWPEAEKAQQTAFSKE